MLGIMGKYNFLAAKVRILERSLAFQEPFNPVPVSAGDSEEKLLFCEAQWDSFQAHRRCCFEADKDESNSGRALRDARPYITSNMYNERRATLRKANTLRHSPIPVQNKSWKPKRQLANNTLFYGSSCSLNPDAQEFTPLGIDNFLAYFLPSQETLSDTPCIMPQLIPSVSLDIPLVSDGGVGMGCDDWSSIVKDVLWQVHHLTVQMEALRAQFDPLDVLDFGVLRFAHEYV